MAAALALALGALLVALGGFLVAALAHRGPEGPRLAVTGRAVAHRGGAGERIENTMEAFENAVRQGCDWLELDVRRTRDGVVVVCHDRELWRQSGRHLDVTRTDFRDLPPYRSPLEVTFAPGSFSSGRDRRIPRLVEVFQRFPRQPISIEVKDDDDDLINEVAALVRSFDRAPITLWASFRQRILRKCRRARGLLALLLWYLGLLPRLPLPEAALLFPLPSTINRTYFPLPRGPAGHALSRAAAALVLRPALLQHLKSRGLQVWLWVVNEERDFAEAFGLGATGVITDYPGRLRRFLDGPSPTPGGPSPTPRCPSPSWGGEPLPPPEKGGETGGKGRKVE
ncbi:lysophospholipase D GDPD3-like isoform X2 [Vidua chalybeata]|uniref:lysophospholipase D GDPD3-like isoform X2 n=1 Tax=Vidua chalybeata TaxID=81927 RepID=UPI0023A7E331|nr:lysophospholipase D GDPD3-like isoform X2 [Vidua chalybeata]